MPWYQMLALGTLGGFIVSGVFAALGWAWDRFQDRRWEREMDDMRDESGS